MADSVFEDIGTFQEWDAEYYAPASIRHYDRAIDRMLRWLDPEPESVVLDAGCGPGEHCIRVARAGFRVHGIDMSGTVLHEARRRIQRAGQDAKVTLEQGDLTHLAHPDGCFTAAYAWGVVVHIPTAAQALSELARVLRPGGRLALQVTNLSALDLKLEDAARWITKRPRIERERFELGDGSWYWASRDRLWVWRIDITALVRTLEGFGCHLERRCAAEFSELHRFARAGVRRPLLGLNDLWFGLRLPARLACTNLLVFRKDGVRR